MSEPDFHEMSVKLSAKLRQIRENHPELAEEHDIRTLDEMIEEDY